MSIFPNPTFSPSDAYFLTDFIGFISDLKDSLHFLVNMNTTSAEYFEKMDGMGPAALNNIQSTVKTLCILTFPIILLLFINAPKIYTFISKEEEKIKDIKSVCIEPVLFMCGLISYITLLTGFVIKMAHHFDTELVQFQCMDLLQTEIFVPFCTNLTVFITFKSYLRYDSINLSVIPLSFISLFLLFNQYYLKAQVISSWTISKITCVICFPACYMPPIAGLLVTVLITLVLILINTETNAQTIPAEVQTPNLKLKSKTIFLAVILIAIYAQIHILWIKLFEPGNFGDHICFLYSLMLYSLTSSISDGCKRLFCKEKLSIKSEECVITQNEDDFVNI